MLIGTHATSPPSQQRRCSKRSSPCEGWNPRVSALASRTARGPKRAPGRYVVPPSNGAPQIITSTSRGSSCCGSRRNVGTPANRGTCRVGIGRKLFVDLIERARGESPPPAARGDAQRPYAWGGAPPDLLRRGGAARAAPRHQPRGGHSQTTSSTEIPGRGSWRKASAGTSTLRSI